MEKYKLIFLCLNNYFVIDRVVVQSKKVLMIVFIVLVVKFKIGVIAINNFV